MYEIIQFSQLSKAEQDVILADALAAVRTGDTTKYIWHSAQYRCWGTIVIVEKRIA